MHTRDLSTAQCLVYALRSDKATKVAIDWTTLTSYLAGSEVNQSQLYVHVPIWYLPSGTVESCFSGVFC